MKLHIKLHAHALAPAAFAVMVCAASSAQAKAPAAGRAPKTQRSPTVLQGAVVATEARAREIAWHNYALSMRGEPGAPTTDRVQSVTCYTLGGGVEDYAQKGEKVWEVRITDASADLRAIIWVHSATREVKFLISPELDPERMMRGFLSQPRADAVVPAPASVKGVVIRKLRHEPLSSDEGTHKAITADEFKEMLGNSKPLSDEAYAGMSIPGLSHSYKGSFETPAGIYYFSIYGSIMYLSTPSGGGGRYTFSAARPE